MNIFSDCKNILCIRPDNMGDVIMTSPAIRAIKEAVKDVNITLLTSKSGASIVPYLPFIDDVIVYDLPWVKVPELTQSEQLLQFIQSLKIKAFDAAIIFTNYSQTSLPSALLCYLADIKIRVAYCRENPYGLLTYWAVDKEPFVKIEHGVMRQLQLVKQAGIPVTDTHMRLTIQDKDMVTVMKKLLANGVDPTKPFIVAHVGVSEEKRQYPLPLYTKAIQLLQQQTHMPIILTGIEKEKDSIQFVTNVVKHGVYSFAGKTSVGELIALIQKSSLLLSPNTGSVHIASAVGTPVVVLYARTNPEHTPWQVPQKVLYFDVPISLQSKNQIIAYTTPKEAKQSIEPEMIVSACMSLLRKVPHDIPKGVSLWQ